MSSKRKKTIKIFIFLTIILGAFSIINIYRKNNEINYILENKNYSYLPLEAKNYIKNIYEETGDIILTERNKVVKQPYLNPAYIEYLALSKEEQSEYDVIPDEIIVDYSYIDAATLLNEEEIPSKFDLRNVNGKNYVTSIKNQGGLGLCWAFATNAQIESLLLIKNNQSSSESTQRFSERQIDYATANDGIIDSSPFYSYNRILGDGGTFKYATSVMIDSLGLVDDSWVTYDDNNYEPKEKNEVYNFDNSLYEVTKTITYPNLNLSELDLTSSEDRMIRKNYLNNLKSLIMQYGGSYISTADPSGKCSVAMNGSRFMYDDGVCSSAGHAMQVIGWDDDYEYSVCTGTKDANGYYHINKNNSATCNGGKVISGKGAWILKNSWGNAYPYVYIAYNSKNMAFNITTELDEKDWDNYYSLNTNIYSISGSTITKTYIKKSDYQEKLNKIKFSTGTQDEKYNIYVAPDGKNFNLYKTITSDFPGLYTVDLSDKNIILSEKEFQVKITSSSGKISSEISVYTDNIEESYQITTKDTTYENTLTNINKYILRISSETINIPDNEYIDYKILDKNDEEITTKYTYTENTVFANNIFSKILIDDDLEKGIYKLQTIYKGNVLAESNIIIEKDIVTIDGTGTEEDPYIIRTPAQLDLIRKDAFSFYELANDIDLTYDTTNENGLFYNEGKGWEPIKYSEIKTSTEYVYSSDGFSGGFNGNNYKIIGLNINRPEESSVGLFAYTYNLNFSNLHIKNLILENPNITGKDYVAGVVGAINGTTYERHLNISNIAVNGGKIKGNNYVGGVIGYLRAGSHLSNYYVGGERHLIDSLYNSATIEAENYAGGIFGYVTNITGYKQGNSVFKISNILNKGTIISDNSAGGIIGSIRTRENNYITILNTLNTGIVKGTNCSGGIVCELSSSSVGNLNLSSIYYIDDVGMKLTNNYITTYNIMQKTISEIKDINSYKNWKNFNDIWKIETINGITRMPVLKFMNFDYTNLSNISIRLGDKVNIDDYIKPNIEAAYNFDVEIEDSQIISLKDNYILEGIKTGNTTLHFTSYYDGIVVDIPVTVTSAIIKYFSNYGDNKSIIQNIENSEFKIKDNEFTRIGYVFKEWNTESDGSGTSYQDGQVMKLDKELILYAQWEKETYTLTFNANDGTGTINAQTFTYDTEQKINKNTFTKDGHTFIGWNTKSDGTGENYTDEEEIKLSDDLTLYAQWEKETYTLTFNANDGTGTMNAQTFTYDAEQKITKNLFTKEEYIFTGWNTISDGTGETYKDEEKIKLTKNITLYAQWEKEIYILTFDGNSASGEMETQIFNYDKEQKITKNSFTKEGHTFTGWNTKSDGTGENYTDEEEIKLSDDLTLYAQWNINKYLITFNANNGNGRMDAQTFTYDKEQKITKNSFEKKGHTFIGWNTKADGSGKSYSNEEEIKLTKKITLYAQWKKETYVLTFNVNSGSGKMETQIFNYDKEQKITKNSFTKEGHTFTGWNTKTDGSGKSYTDEEKIKITNNITLYAQWKESYSYMINKYPYDNKNKYIDKIDINTLVNNFEKNIKLNIGYSIKVDGKKINNNNLLFTGGKTKIFKNNILQIEYKNIIRGEVNGDGKINYLDYVNVYNHIRKVKHPELSKEELTDVYLIAADLSDDGKVDYLDYVKIYNKIKELKGGTN